MDDKTIAGLRKLIEEATPLEKWEGSGNYPFYVHIQKPAPSLSKHEGTARGENMWRYQDGSYLLAAVHALPKALDKIQELQEAFDQSFADYQDLGREMDKALTELEKQLKEAEEKYDALAKATGNN